MSEFFEEVKKAYKWKMQEELEKQRKEPLMKSGLFKDLADKNTSISQRKKEQENRLKKEKELLENLKKENVLKAMEEAKYALTLEQRMVGQDADTNRGDYS